MNVIRTLRLAGRSVAAAGLAIALTACGDESITRAAGGVNGQEFGPPEMIALARSAKRPARQRTTLYELVPDYRPAMTE